VITVVYSSIDRFRKKRTFKTLAGARKFAQEWVGKNPDMGTSYAVADDGVGKIEAWGCKLADLFGDEPKPAKAGELPDSEFTIYIVHGSDRWFMTLAEAEAEVRACVERDPGGLYGPYGIEEATITKNDLTPPAQQQT
jgi:hypothetical protein